MYVAQRFFQAYSSDAAAGVDRIATTIPPDESAGMEFYLNDWLRWSGSGGGSAEIYP